MNTWDNRPQELSGNELIAWALCQLADALAEGNHEIAEAICTIDDGTSISNALDKLTDALIYVGTATGGLTTIGGLQYLADRVGGNLERLADHAEKLAWLRESAD